MISIVYDFDLGNCDVMKKKNKKKKNEGLKAI